MAGMDKNIRRNNFSHASFGGGLFGGSFGPSNINDLMAEMEQEFFGGQMHPGRPNQRQNEFARNDQFDQP